LYEVQKKNDKELEEKKKKKKRKTLRKRMEIPAKERHRGSQIVSDHHSEAQLKAA